MNLFILRHAHAVDIGEGEVKCDEDSLLVGHSPDLDLMVERCLVRHSGGFIQLKKAGLCCIEFSGAPAAGSGILRMLIG